jgi:hypothetical protein
MCVQYRRKMYRMKALLHVLRYENQHFYASIERNHGSLAIRTLTQIRTAISQLLNKINLTSV